MPAIGVGPDLRSNVSNVTRCGFMVPGARLRPLPVLGPLVGPTRDNFIVEILIQRDAWYQARSE